MDFYYRKLRSWEGEGLAQFVSRHIEDASIGNYTAHQAEDQQQVLAVRLQGVMPIGC